MKNQKINWDGLYKNGDTPWEGKVSRDIPELTKNYLIGRRNILDVGCGSGRNSIFFAKQGFTVCGFDISIEAIKKAQRKAKLKNLQFLQGNMKNMPFGDESFDAVCCMYVIHFLSSLEEIKQIFLEIFRVLKKSGIVLVRLFTKTKVISSGEETEFHRKEEITSICKETNFKIIKEKEFENKDVEPEPHIHYLLELVLQK